MIFRKSISFYRVLFFCSCILGFNISAQAEEYVSIQNSSGNNDVRARSGPKFSGAGKAPVVCERLGPNVKAKVIKREWPGVQIEIDPNTLPKGVSCPGTIWVWRGHVSQPIARPTNFSLTKRAASDGGGAAAVAPDPAPAPPQAAGEPRAAAADEASLEIEKPEVTGGTKQAVKKSLRPKVRKGLEKPSESKRKYVPKGPKAELLGKPMVAKSMGKPGKKSTYEKRVFTTKKDIEVKKDGTDKKCTIPKGTAAAEARESLSGDIYLKFSKKVWEACGFGPDGLHANPSLKSRELERDRQFNGVSPEISALIDELNGVESDKSETTSAAKGSGMDMPPQAGEPAAEEAQPQDDLPAVENPAVENQEARVEAGLTQEECKDCDAEVSKTQNAADQILSAVEEDQVYQPRKVKNRNGKWEAIPNYYLNSSECSKFVSADGELGNYGKRALQAINDVDPSGKCFYGADGGKPQAIWSQNVCPKFPKFSRKEMEKFWVFVTAGMAWDESRCKLNARNKTAPNGWADGLFQLEYSNAQRAAAGRSKKWCKAGIPWNSRQLKFQFECMASTFVDVHCNEGRTIGYGTAYWQELKYPDRRISQIVKRFPGCF